MSEAFDPYHRWLGIAPKDQPPHHYRLLGIDLYENDKEVIRDAAERQMAHVRKYQLGQNSAISQKMLNEIAAAKSCLIDPAKKAKYDRSLKPIVNNPPPLPPSAPILADNPVFPAVETKIEKASGFFKNLIPSRYIQVKPLYIGLGVAVILVGILAAIFEISGDNADSTIPNPNNQITQAAGPTEPNPSNQNARTDTPGNGKPAEQSVGGTIPNTPSTDDNLTPAGNDGYVTEGRDRDLSSTVKTERKLDIVGEPKTNQPQQRSKLSSSDRVNPSPSKNSILSDAPKVSSKDLNNKAQSRKKDKPRSKPEDQLSSLTPIPQSKTSKVKPKYKSPYSSSMTYGAINLSLPSGKTFNSRLFDVDIKSAEDKLEDILKDKDDLGQVIQLQSPSGNTPALAEHDKGKLDGVYLAFYRDKFPMIYANYSDGSCNGMIKKWNENGERVYWCQYIKGVRHGFCCYFKDDILRIFYEINRGEYTAVHLCSNSELIKSFDSREKAASDEDAKIFIDEVNEVETELKSMEINYRKQLLKAYKQIQNKIIGMQNQEKRDAFNDRMNQRTKARDEQTKILKKMGGY